MSLIYKLTSNKAKIVKAFKDPLFGLGLVLNQIAPLIKNDETFLKWSYYLKFHKKLHLDNPQTFNEKLQWLKLHDRKPEYTQMVDKAEAKKYVANIIGDEYIIPTFGVYERWEEIDFSQLPTQFVIKCTHDSGGIVICKDKKTFNIQAARKKIEYGLGKSAYWATREWPYKNVTPRIIIEKYMEDESGWQLKDYKIFCFNGRPELIEVDYDRYVGHKLNVYDKDWNYIDFYMTSPNDPNVHIARPQKLETMMECAAKLSEGIKFLRVDFYSIQDKVFFGELTLYPGGGCIDFHPINYDNILGGMLQIK